MFLFLWLGLIRNRNRMYQYFSPLKFGEKADQNQSLLLFHVQLKLILTANLQQCLVNTDNFYEKSVDSPVLGEFGMNCSRHYVPLAHQNRCSVAAGESFDSGTN